MGWWECYALSPTGDVVVPRLFRRSAALSAAHVAFLAARFEHKRRLPKEPLVHLFDFGEEFEGGFERWLIGRKQEDWDPGRALPQPGDEPGRATHDVFRAEEGSPTEVSPNGGDSPSAEILRVGEMSSSELTEPGRKVEVARQMKDAYRASKPGKLLAPFFRIRS